MVLGHMLPMPMHPSRFAVARSDSDRDPDHRGLDPIAPVAPVAPAVPAADERGTGIEGGAAERRGAASHG